MAPASQRSTLQDVGSSTEVQFGAKTSSDPPDRGRSGPAHALVLDCDGVIADTVDAWSDAFVQVGRRHGLTLAHGQLAQLRGSAIRPASESFARWLGGAVPERAQNYWAFLKQRPAVQRAEEKEGQGSALDPLGP